MEEERQLTGRSRDLREVQEVYRQPLPGEVVERYARDLPWLAAPQSPPPPPPRQHRRRGLWIFLICLMVVLGVTAGVWISALLNGPEESGGEYSLEGVSTGEEITIPTSTFKMARSFRASPATYRAS